MNNSYYFYNQCRSVEPSADLSILLSAGQSKCHFVQVPICLLNQVAICLSADLSCTHKTDRHDITELLLKVILSTITPTLAKFLTHFLTTFKKLNEACSIKTYEVPGDGRLKKIYGWLAQLRNQFYGMWLSCINCFYGLLGQEKPWCFIFSAKLRYEEDFFERIFRILYFFVMFWHSNRHRFWFLVNYGLVMPIEFELPPFENYGRC